MICLTGDIHHSSLRTGNQRACDITEIQVAHKFLSLLERHNVKATLFVTGKAFAEEWPDIKPLCEHPLISIQGHGYNCFEPQLFHRIWNKLTGNYNGPAPFERRDIRKTIDIIRDKTGRQIICWRNHMYMHGPNTSRILAEEGIKICSDGVNKGVVAPELDEFGLWQFPINVMPDHEHLYHAERTVEWVERWVKRYNWSDDFGSRSYAIGEWTDLVIQQIEANLERGAISNIIIHPITLYLCDKFDQFERILELLSKQETVLLDDLANRREDSIR